MSNCFPQFPAFSFDFGRDTKFHLSMASQIHAANKFNHNLALFFFQSKIGNNGIDHFPGFIICTLPKINTLVLWIFGLMFIERSTKNFIKQLGHNLFCADISYFGNIVSWAMGILFPNGACATTNSNKTIGINCTSAISVKSIFFHNNPIIPKEQLIDKKIAGRLLDGREWREMPPGNIQDANDQ